MIKYIGSKRLLIPQILSAVEQFAPKTVLDLFSGTSRVGHALKLAGYRVLANDHNAYAATLARCYVQADAEDVFSDATRLADEFNALKGSPGYFTETFCVQSHFFQPKNGERVDAIREEIERKGLRPELQAVMLVSLMEAADRVDSTCGVQMAYLREWAPRANNDLTLRTPYVLNRAAFGKGWSFALDAMEAAGSLDADVVYIDPPYNQHSYLSNYHIWESLIRWDKPEVYGVACKRIDCKTRKSKFNWKSKCVEATDEVLAAVRAKNLVISLSNEGFISRANMEMMLGDAYPGAQVEIQEIEYKRYVGAQIGIYNPQGDKVGTPDHLTNKEMLFIVRREV